MRITDFTDINETDKHFFIAWNQAMYAAKRGSEFLSEEDLRELLHNFAKIAKKKNFKRISMLIHSWTLFSVGKISAEDVTTFLNVFDTAEAWYLLQNLYKVEGIDWIKWVGNSPLIHHLHRHRHYRGSLRSLAPSRGFRCLPSSRIGTSCLFTHPISKYSISHLNLSWYQFSALFLANLVNQDIEVECWAGPRNSRKFYWRE